jgi:hypothetical protein
MSNQFPILSKVLKHHFNDIHDRITNSTELNKDEKEYLLMVLYHVEFSIDIKEKFKELKDINKEIKEALQSFTNTPNQGKKESANNLAKLINQSYDEFHKSATSSLK